MTRTGWMDLLWGLSLWGLSISSGYVGYHNLVANKIVGVFQVAICGGAFAVGLVVLLTWFYDRWE